MEQMIEITQEDLNADPAVRQALENIALKRMVRERDAEIARLKDGKEAMQPIAAVPPAEKSG